MTNNATSMLDVDPDFCEVLVDALSKAWDKRDSYDPDVAEYAGWLYRVAQRHALDELRRRRGWKYDLLAAAQQLDGVASNDEGPTDSHWLRECLSLLPEHNRRLLLDWHLADKDEKEHMATECGLTYLGLATKVRRVREQLRTTLSSLSKDDEELFRRWCSPVIDDSETAREFGFTSRELAIRVDRIRDELRDGLS